MIAWLRSKFYPPVVYCASCIVAPATMTSYDETPICEPCAVALAKFLTQPKKAPSIKRKRRGR
jgi:hypothetical protein